MRNRKANTKVANKRNYIVGRLLTYYAQTGENRYFRNMLYKELNSCVHYALKTLVQDGVVTRVKVKNAVAYQLCM